MRVCDWSSGGPIPTKTMRSHSRGADSKTSPNTDRFSRQCARVPDRSGSDGWYGVGDPAPGGLVAPDVLAQALELQDLRVVDEQVDLVAIVLDVPLEHLWVRGFEHDLLQADTVDDGRDRAGVP